MDSGAHWISVWVGKSYLWHGYKALKSIIGQPQKYFSFMLEKRNGFVSQALPLKTSIPELMVENVTW